MTALARTTLEKTPVEVLFWYADFADKLVAAGEALTGTPTITATLSYQGNVAGTLPTIDQKAISGTKVTWRIQGGLDGNIYRLDISCNTTATDGNTRTREGDVMVAVND